MHVIILYLVLRGVSQVYITSGRITLWFDVYNSVVMPVVQM